MSTQREEEVMPMAETDRVANVEVTVEQMVVALGWPCDTDVLQLAFCRLTKTFHFKVRHPFLKEVAKGARIPFTFPNMINRDPDVWFVSWGAQHDELAERGDD